MCKVAYCRVASVVLMPAVAVLCRLIILSLVGAHEEHIEVAKKQVTLKDVCSNALVPLISVQEVNRLIKELEEDVENEICLDKYRQSFFELVPILMANERMTICSEAKFEQVRSYHFRYINPKRETYKFGDDLNHLGKKVVYEPLDENKVDYTVQLDEYNQENYIPIALQQFFKAYVLQISGLCKQALVYNIDQAMRMMSDHDFEIFEGDTLRSSVPALQAKTEPNSKGSGQESSSELMGPSKYKYRLNFRDLVYMPELEGELDEGDIRRSQETTLIDLRGKPELNEVMHACEKRFRPIYSELVLPIVRLAKLGYEYVGSQIVRIEDQLRSSKVMTWLAVTMACEARGKIKLISADDEEHMEQLEFHPVTNYVIEGPLWIKGAEALAREFRNLNGARARGFQKFVYDVKLAGKKFVAAIDPHQFAWYRRNQNTLSSGLNILSIFSNIAAMANG